MTMRGKWALVTGASGGMGAEFAKLLAERGANVVIAARNLDRLEMLAHDLRSRSGIEVHVERSDLSDNDAPPSLFNAVKDRGISLDVLVNNAGQGLHGAFVDQSAEAIARMLQLNMMGLTALTHLVAQDMVRKGGGHILLVSSLTAFMPSPTYAAYAASKAYVRHLGEALHAELKPQNVIVTVLSPGLMDTGFLTAAGQKASKSMLRSMISPTMAAQVGLKALFAGRQSVVAGSMNKVIAVASRLIPRKAQTNIMAAALDG